MKAFRGKSWVRNKQGFTLIELIIAIGFFGFISAILMSSLLSVYRFRDAIRYKKDLNFEASSILNNGIPGLIRSGFAINYNKTAAQNSHGTAEEGVKEETDQISIYTDAAETQYFTIYRKPYQTEGDVSDTAPLYLRFKNGEEFPLHTSEVVVEDFDIQVPGDPRLGGDPAIQPYVRVYLRLRKRYPFGEMVDESTLAHHKTIRASYSTTITLRNAGPNRNKHPLDS